MVALVTCRCVVWMLGGGWVSRGAWLLLASHIQ